MNLREVVADRMRDDATLLALLAGGVHTGAQLTPVVGEAPFDAYGRVQPSALVRQETAAADGPGGQFDRLFLLVFFYDAAGYEVIDQAADRTREMLHGYRPGERAYEVRHVDDVYDQYDDALLAFMLRSRYQVVRMRGDP